jgi:hypothetical protein
MHDNLMNTFTIEEDLNAATEWVFTFPTKNQYVDPTVVGTITYYEPNPADPGCNGWDPGEPFPTWTGDHNTMPTGWQQCEYLKFTFVGDAIPPFTNTFDGTACEVVSFADWDREESPSTPGTPGDDPPVVSPPPPPGTLPPGPSPFALCYEVNRLQFGDVSIFGDTDLMSTVSGTAASGWANLNFSYNVDLKDGLGKIEHHQDSAGLVGLPVTGFSAEQYENGFLNGGTVLANYGGLDQHKGSVRRIAPNCELHDRICDND